MAKISIKDPKKLKKELKFFLYSLLGREETDEYFNPPEIDKKKGKLAEIIDVIAVRIVVFFALGYISSKFLQFQSSVFAALLGTVLIHIFLKKRQKIKAETLKEKIQQCNAGMYTYEKIMKMEPEGEFKIFITQVLNGLKGFSGMKNAGSGYDGIDILGNLNKKIIGVNCTRYDKEKQVEWEEIREFAEALKRYGISRGIFLTTSSFSDWAIDYVRSISGEVKIALVSRDKLIEWVKLSNHSIYPSEAEINTFQAEKDRQEKMVSLRKKQMRNKSLMRSFFLVTIYLTVLSIFMKQWLDNWMLVLYLVIAVLNLGAGLTFYYLYLETKELINEIGTLDHLD